MNEWMNEPTNGYEIFTVEIFSFLQLTAVEKRQHSNYIIATIVIVVNSIVIVAESL